MPAMHPAPLFLFSPSFFAAPPRGLLSGEEEEARRTDFASEGEGRGGEAWDDGDEVPPLLIAGFSGALSSLGGK